MRKSCDILWGDECRRENDTGEDTGNKSWGRLECYFKRLVKKDRSYLTKRQVFVICLLKLSLNSNHFTKDVHINKKYMENTVSILSFF